MNSLNGMAPARKLVFGCGLALCVAWLLAHARHLLAPEQHGLIRFTLSALMAALILLRPKPNADSRAARPSVILSIGFSGALAAILGLIFHVGQVEWLGVLMVLWACLRWAMPPRCAADIAYALLLVYWAHPLPTVIFGPLQLWMQNMSVRGSEWLLLALDARAWADGQVLRTGFSVYEVPDWCSGMRTATTVFILSLGLAILNRLRWKASVVIVFAALVQALLLNIVRITTMVVFVPKLADRSSIAYLHDTAGWIVLLAVILVYAEIALWRSAHIRRLDMRAHNTDDENRIARTARTTTRRWMAAVVVLALIAGGGVGIYRNLPSRRAAVLKEITLAARDAENFAEALYLARVVETRAEGKVEDEWRLMKLRLMLLMHQFDALLEEIDRVHGDDVAVTREKNVLKGYALMALDRLEEAADVISDLPESLKLSNPRVAMIMAQIAFEHDDSDAVARYIRVAARWGPNLKRISMLYPYLRSRHQWNAIVDTDKLPHYDNAAVALSVSEAYMHLNRPFQVAQIATQAASSWPSDLRVLEPLYYMSIKRPESEWEWRFAQHLHSVINKNQNIDELFILFEKCFDLARPDLSWAVYEHIRQLDPAHPALQMSVVLHGNVWFTFRRRFLRFSSPTAAATIDLRSFYWMGKSQKNWRWRCEQIPHGDDLAAENVTDYRKRCLALALDEFRARRERNDLSLVMRYLFVEALEIENAGDAWKTELNSIEEDYPDEAERVRLTTSEIYERRMDWQNVYELLRGYDEQGLPQLNALVRLSRAQRELRLGPAALRTADTADRHYPQSALAKSELTEAYFLNNMPEQAVFLLSQQEGRHIREHDILYARALRQTERYRELERFCRSALLPVPPFDDTTPQREVLPPAELTLIWNHAYIPPESSFEKNAQILQFNQSRSTSPFLNALIDLWLTCYAQDAEGDSADLARWEACGRDATEKALALNQLTLLLCRSDKLTEASVAAARASALLPGSAVLWRWTISLNGGQEEMVAAARQQCSRDSELWLAELSLAVRSSETDRVAPLVAEASPSRNSPFDAEALTRAGELLFRYGHYEPASELSALAAARSRGLLPAHIQSLRCALFDRDQQRAIYSVEAALASSVRPPDSLYRKLVELKSVDDLDTDGSMLNALKRLRSNDPDDPLWAEMLGYVRFKRGGWEVTDAVTQFMDALNIGSTNRMTYIMAAETSRLMNNHERACDVLENAMRRFPDDLEIINNFAYALSAIPLRSSSATNYVDVLLKNAPANVHFLDTVATVYTRAGHTQAAKDTLLRISALVEQGSPEWLRAKALEAELLAGNGEFTAAITLLRESMASSQMGQVKDENIIDMRRKLDQWDKAHKEKEALRQMENRESVITVDRGAVPPEQ